MSRLTVFTSALLLFLVQPLVARLALPRLGGSAQTWNTCMVFFQVTLLAGYAYAHALARPGRERGAVAVHALVVIAAWWTLPLTFEPTRPPPGEGTPVVWLLAKLAGSVGPAFLALSATGPLVQWWLAGSGREGASDPYFLFAASNAGSLAAVAAYPLLVEPFLTLRAQRLAWSGGYLAFIALLLATGLRLVWHRSGRSVGPSPDPTPGPEAVALSKRAPDGGGWIATGPGDTTRGGPPTARPPARLRWLALAFVPTSLLLGITADLANELPSVPLIWLVPLLLYLLSFALVFARRPWVPHEALVKVYPLVLSVLAIVLFVPTRVSGYSLHLGAFLVVALVLHGELARGRPHPSRLTEYYLLVATGGALAGVLHALVAPLLFSFVAELPLAVVAACLLRPGPDEAGGGRRTRILDWVGPSLLAVFTVGFVGSLPWLGDFRDTLVRVPLLFLAAMVAHWFRGRRLRFALGVAAVLAGGFQAFRLDGVLTMRRSFYGAYRVRWKPATGLTTLLDGTTVQGAQRHAEVGGVPTSYYHPSTALGRLLARCDEPGARLAGIGLGIGALAWYTHPGQHLTFLELDPVVRDLARDPRYFTLLAEARGEIEVVVGDGRISLAGIPDASLRALVVDAFASAAVPVHLLTREAVALYVRKLAPGGVLAMNVTNRHLELDRVMAAAAGELGLVARISRPRALTAEEVHAGLAVGRWVLIARREEDLARLAPVGGPWEPLESDGQTVVWTDDYSSLVSVLRW